jgi:hypothetical protein
MASIAPHDNSPYSVARPPFPNVVVGLGRRVEVHVATLSYTSGTPAVVAAKSSPGVSVTDTAAGRITINFPAGGDNAFGWVVASLQGAATPANTHFSLDSDLDDYAAGTVEVQVFADDADATADDADFVDCTFLIFVVKDANA